MTNFEKKITQISWQFGYDRRMTYQKIRLFYYGYHISLSETFGVKLGGNYLCRVINGVVSQYEDLNEYTAGFTEIEKQFLDKNAGPFLKKLKDIIVINYAEFEKYIQVMPELYSGRTNKELNDDYRNFYERENTISMPSWLLWKSFEEIITKALHNSLQENFKENEVNTILQALSQTDKLTPLDTYHKAIYEIVLASPAEKNELTKKFLDIYKHWGMYDVNYQVPPRKMFLQKIAEVNEAEARQEMEQIEEKYRNIRKDKDVAEKKLPKNEYLEHLTALYSCYADNKDWKNYVREQASYKQRFLMEEIAKRASLTLDQVTYLTEQEMENVLVNKLSVMPENIDKRIKNSAYLFLEGKLHIITDVSTLAILDRSLSQSSQAEIKGTGAFPGSVKGTVKIILSSDDFDKLNQGDVLVTSTTRPDFVPIMKIASAFVTNEGGLLSHAAIIARELKKPCVIGTKNATKLLRDGDVVEVDANNGIVRKLT